MLNFKKEEILKSLLSGYRLAKDELAQERNAGKYEPAYQVFKKGTADVVRVACPGTLSEQLKVQSRDGNLIIKKSTDVEKGKIIGDLDIVVTTPWELSFPFSDDDDVEDISASLKAGILTVLVPKKGRTLTETKTFDISDEE